MNDIPFRDHLDLIGDELKRAIATADKLPIAELRDPVKEWLTTARYLVLIKAREHVDIFTKS